MRRIWHILGLVIARIYILLWDLDNQTTGDFRFALFPCTGERDYQLDHVGTFFLYIYTFMVLVELDVGNIMPYVTREAPSTTSFCHDDSTVIYFLTCDND